MEQTVPNPVNLYPIFYKYTSTNKSEELFQYLQFMLKYISFMIKNNTINSLWSLAERINKILFSFAPTLKILFFNIFISHSFLHILLRNSLYILFSGCGKVNPALSQLK